MIDPEKSKMKKYNSMQYLLKKKEVGAARINETQTKLIITGSKAAELTIQQKESKYGGQLFTVFGSIGAIGYVVITDDGELKGKLTTHEGVKFQITKGILHYPYPANLLIGRSRALGTSELKTEVAKRLLSDLEGRTRCVLGF